MYLRLKKHLALLTLGWLIASGVNAGNLFSESDEWKVVGKACLKVFWFEIYDATLFTRNGRFQDYSQPLAIKLSYKRNIYQDELIAETEKQLKRFVTDAKLRKSWITQLSDIWPDIQKGDALIYLTDDEGIGHFIFNQASIGHIQDPDFAQTFPKIWLSSKGQYPKLAAQLRGADDSGVHR